MGKMKVVTAAVLLMVVFVYGNSDKLVVRKVKAGDTAVLPCVIDDDIYRFQYWQLNNDQILGPWNNDEQGKIRYEIWTGKLVIKNVSEKESGFYRCFSKHISRAALVTGTVELVVKSDSEPFEKNTMVNTYRGIIGVLVILLLFLVGTFAFIIKRRKIISIRESRESSPDDMIPATDSKGVYRSTSISLSKPSTSRFKSAEQRDRDRGLENEIVETDISTSFSLPN